MKKKISCFFLFLLMVFVLVPCVLPVSCRAK